MPQTPQKIIVLGGSNMDLVTFWAGFPQPGRRGVGGARPEAKGLPWAGEGCSIHYHYGWNPQHIVANALFADGSAAVVGAMREHGGGWPIQASGA